MSETTFKHLRMTVASNEGKQSLQLGIDSGFASFTASIPLLKKDVAIIKADHERAAFLQAALHHPFQLKETRLNNTEQRYFLDQILHSEKSEVEAFLTEIDHGEANGAISNMVRLTCGKDPDLLRKGQWFD